MRAKNNGILAVKKRMKMGAVLGGSVANFVSLRDNYQF